MNSCTKCEYKTKKKSNLKRHLWVVHNIGEGETFSCTYTDCNTEDKCTYETRKKSHLKRHAQIHSSTYKQRQKIKEQKVFNILQEHFAVKREHQINFRCINKDESYCRVDFLIIERGILFMVECDEFQHIQYTTSCELKRMCYVNETLMMDGNTLPICFIRFNPDHFEVDGVCRKVRLKYRYQALISYINTYEPQRSLGVKYLFYDRAGGREVVTYDEDYDKNFYKAHYINE